jgi:rRNA maturation endonuclease Nob1
VKILFCSNCGKKVSEKANFCSECGMRTQRGTEISQSKENSLEQDLEEGLTKMGRGIGRAFSIAGKELEKAFKPKERIICKNCEQSNTGNDKFCRKCGNKLA